jgi:Putative adhesin
MPAYESLAPIEADIDVSSGHVEVIASDRADTAVEVTPTNPGRSGDVSLAREATVTFEDNHLRVRVPGRLKVLGPGRDSVDVRVELPTGSRATIETGNGSVRVRGKLGATRIVAKYGNVSADRVGDLALVSPHGEADIAEVGGELDVKAAHGHVRIGRIAGAARLRGAHGTLVLGTTEGQVDVATSGSLTIERALGDVTARTAYGAIRVLEAEGGVLRLESAYKEVEVGVPAGVAAWVDAASAHGVIRNELTPDPEAAGTDRTIELHLRANWADVLIRRAAPRSA